jgi:hypothetical protein
VEPNHVLPTQREIDRLADRIESAYELRTRRWWWGCSTRRVWAEAALRLWQAHAADPARIPLDAELFVASQPISACFPDPWTELAQTEAVRHYRRLVRQIVRQLRSELKREVRWAEKLIRQGRPLEELLTAKDGRISPLGCYITALRAGRLDVAMIFASAACDQHRSCALYRQSSLSLLPVAYYPSDSVVADSQGREAVRAPKLALSLN